MDDISQEPVNALKDSLGRRIDYLRISITDKCNLKCIYCISDKQIKYYKRSEILTYEEIIRFVRIVHKHGLLKVRITGGEPLIRKDVAVLVSSLKEIGIRDLSMTTNGIRLAEMAGELKRAGLDRVNISLDTLDADKYSAVTQGGDIDRVWLGIKEAELVGLKPIKINVVPMYGVNDDEVIEFARLTFDKDYHVRFIELMPVGGNKKWKQQAFVKKETLIQKISSLGKLVQLEFKGKGPSRNYRIKGAKGMIGFISPISECFCSYCNRLRLTADGRMRPCLFSDTDIDIKTPMRSGMPDNKIEELILEAISSKPAGHSPKNKRALYTKLPAMSKIGG